jgi:4-amino-4-deoxy-L-arabinose transferase-like glycosyltransferase
MYSFHSIAVFGLLVILLSVLGFSFLGGRGIWEPDEGYYIGAAVNMLDKGTYLVPRLGEEGEDIFLEKPPMIYWGIMAGLKIFGHNEFGARAFNAFCYLLTCLSVGLLGFYTFGNRIDATASAFIYATMIIPFIASGFVTPDTPLTLWTTLAAAAFWNSIKPDVRSPAVWKIMLCFAVGAGFLAKGPAALIPWVGMFSYLMVTRQTGRYLFSRWMFAGLAVFCMAGLSWYVYVSIKFPGAAGYFFDNQVWGRLFSEKYDRNPGMKGALIYLPVIILGSLPWLVIWWEKRTLIRNTFFRKQWRANLASSPQALFLVCLFFVPLCILCLASSKLGLYALPLFPALAVATARLWRQKMPSAVHARMADNIKIYARPAVLISLWIFVLLGVKLGVAHYPTGRDARALWKEISDYLPAEGYEIVMVDEQANGLLFYGVKEVEKVTRRNKPYPTFAVPENITRELNDAATEKLIFLVQGDCRIAETEKYLEQAGIAFEKISLKNNKVLLICRQQGLKTKNG